MSIALNTRGGIAKRSAKNRPASPLALARMIQRQGGRVRGRAVATCAALFTLVCAAAWVFNYREVHWLGALLFATGLLAPLLLYLELTNLGLNQNFVRRLLRLLETLLLINLVIGSSELIPPLLSGEGGGADLIFGTFGQNQNRLAFFLATMAAYRVSQYGEPLAINARCVRYYLALQPLAQSGLPSSCSVASRPYGWLLSQRCC